jgi:hypothetical protein
MRGNHAHVISAANDRCDGLYGYPQEKLTFTKL